MGFFMDMLAVRLGSPSEPAYLLAIPVLLFDWRRRLVAGAAVAVLTRLVGMIHRSRMRIETRHRVRSLSAAQLRDIGLGPDTVHGGPGPLVDSATLANLMSLR